jgi:hypothetical protein
MTGRPAFDRDSELRELAGRLELEAGLWRCRGYGELADQLHLAAEWCEAWTGAVDREARKP